MGRSLMLAAAVAALALTASVAPAKAPAGQSSPGESAATQTPVLYVVYYRPGPAWLPGRPLQEQGLERHGAYMRSLAASGELLVAGPLSTIEGGLVILRAADINAAEALMQADPAVQDGQFIGEVSVWRPFIDPASRFAGAAAD